MKINLSCLLICVSLVSCGKLKEMFGKTNEISEKDSGDNLVPSACTDFEKRLDLIRDRVVASADTAGSKSESKVNATNFQENGVDEGENHVVSSKNIISFAYGRLRITDRASLKQKQVIDLRLGNQGVIHRFENKVAVVQFAIGKMPANVTLFEESQDGLLTKINEGKVSGSIRNTRSIDNLLIVQSDIYLGNKDSKLSELAGNDCKDIVADDPNEVDFSLSELKVFDLADLKELSKKQYFGWSQVAYITKKSYYLFANRSKVDLQISKFIPTSNSKKIARFAINSDGITFAGSTSTKSYVYSQWQIYENNDHFFVVDNNLIQEALDQRSQPGSVIFSYKIGAGSITPLSKSQEFAPGEQIYSTRFFGDLAFVVTYRLKDPFFIFDLSNPSDIKQKGKLVIPGFSNYLHVISKDRILGVGANDQNGAEFSLFNTSNIEQPKLISKADFSENKNFPMNFDHKNFFYEPSTGIVAARFAYMERKEGYSYRDRFSIAKIENDAITKIGFLTHADTFPEVTSNWCGFADALKFMRVDGNYLSISNYALQKHVLEPDVSSTTLETFTVDDLKNKVLCYFTGYRH